MIYWHRYHPRGLNFKESKSATLMNSRTSPCKNYHTVIRVMLFGTVATYTCMQTLLTGHTLPLKVIGFGTPLAIGELKVKLSPLISPVLYLPSGQLSGFPSFDVDDSRRQETN